MQNKGLIVAVVILGALGAGVWYSERLEKEKEGKPPADASPKILELAEGDIQKLEIARRGDEPVSLTRDANGKWTLSTPQNLPADGDAVASVVSTLAAFGSERLVEEKAESLDGFGLQTPALRVSVTTKDGKTRKLLIGDETPTGGGFFAKLDGDPRVFATYSYNRSAVDKTWKDLREKRLMSFNSEQVSRVELTAKGQTIELGKATGGDWQLLKPGPFRGDNLQIDEIVRKIREAKMDVTVADEEAAGFAAAFAAGTPVVTARITDAAGVQQFEVRKSKETYLARSSALNGIFKIAPDSAEGLDKTADDLRNRKLFDFGFTDPERVEIRDGSAVTALTRSGEKWQRNGKDLESSGALTLIDKLRELKAVQFPASGFTSAALELTVSREGGKKIEKVQVSGAGSTFVAKRENEPALYELDPKAVEEIRQAVKDLKEAAPPAKK